MCRLNNFNLKQIKDTSFVMQASHIINIKTNVSHVAVTHKLNNMWTTVGG